MIDLDSLEKLESMIENELGVLVYFSTPTCNVCHALKPKIKEEFEKNFPKIKQVFVDTSLLPEVGAKFNVFSVPTILLFLDRKEFAREGRNISVANFIDRVKRVYEIMMG